MLVWIQTIYETSYQWKHKMFSPLSGSTTASGAISAAGVNGSIPKVSLSTQVWCEYSSILLIFRHPFHGRSHSEHPSSKKCTRKMDLIIEPAMRDIIHLNEHPVHSSHYQMGSNIVDEVVLMSVWQHNGDDSYRDGAFCKMIRTFFFNQKHLRFLI